MATRKLRNYSWVTVTLRADQWATILRCLDASAHPRDASFISKCVRAAVKAEEDKIADRGDL